MQLAANEPRRLHSTRWCVTRPAILSMTCPREKARVAKTPSPFRVGATMSAAPSKLGFLLSAEIRDRIEDAFRHLFDDHRCDKLSDRRRVDDGDRRHA